MTGRMRNGKGTYDLVILGGGSAAFAGAIRANDLGALVLIVNEGLPMGGTCVNVGCVPSKTMIRAAENHHWHGLSRFRGLKASGGRVDFPTLIHEKDDLIAELRREKYADILNGLARVDWLEGRGVLRGPQAVEVDGRIIQAGRILIATGVRPALPPIPGLADCGAWNSTEALSAPFLPERLIVLGGRYIALELSQMFLRLGSNVTLIQRSTQILPEEDRDVAEGLTSYLREEGMDIRVGIRVLELRRKGKAIEVQIEANGSTEALSADAVVYGLGRTPNTRRIGLETCQIEINGDGMLRVNEYLETTCSGVYGAGDVIGAPAFVYAAAYEGGLAAENALNGNRKTSDYTAIFWVIFTDPQVSGVGLNEKEPNHGSRDNASPGERRDER
jgi:mercuric reductase